MKRNAKKKINYIKKILRNIKNSINSVRGSVIPNGNNYTTASIGISLLGGKMNYGNVTVRYRGTAGPRFNSTIKRFAEQLTNNGKTKMVIIGAVMRKLVHIMYAVLKSAKPFDPAMLLKIKN